MLISRFVLQMMPVAYHHLLVSIMLSIYSSLWLNISVAVELKINSYESLDCYFISGTLAYTCAS
jgi:hypothetical protein